MMLPLKFLLLVFHIAVSFSTFGYCVLQNGKAEFRRPHIVIIIADDMGWNDVSFHGADQIPTPNIDALAYNGVILNKHYVLPTCTPSRASLLTGRHAVRHGLQGQPLKTGELRGLPLEETLMPEYLNKLGYATHLVGKWHLGYSSKNYTPTSRGFDSFFGYYNGYVSYFNYSTSQNKIINTSIPIAHDLHRDNPDDIRAAYESKYFTDLITDEAEKIIKVNGNEKPLFLQMGHLAAHNNGLADRLEVRNMDEVKAAFPYIKHAERQKYAGVVMALDESVGRVVTALSEADMLNNSVIIYLHDNGAPTIGVFGNSGSNYPLRGLKHTAFEGAVRVAACIFSPLIKEKSRVSNELVHIVDWLPTLYAAAGGNILDLKGELDGLNQWPSISEGKKSPRKSMLINIDDGEEAAIVGKHKLLKGAKADKSDYFGDIGNDPSYPAYQLNKVLESPAGLAIQRLSGFNSVSKKKARELREKSIVKCKRSAYSNCTNLCLFDLERDPCEAQDVSKQLPNVVEELEGIIERYKEVTKSGKTADIDPCSDAKYFNRTCMPWRISDTLPPHVIPERSCEHPIYGTSKYY